jgi:protein-disulfide isomerase
VAAVNASKLSVPGNAVGATNSDQVAVLFSDFECPFCKKYSLAIDSLLRERPDARIVERHYPIVSLHPAAFGAALAAECAAHLGKYLDMRRVLYREAALVEGQEWGRLAALASISDTTELAQCVNSRQYAADVEADLAAAQKIGVPGTPTLVVGDSIYAPAPSGVELARLLFRKSSKRVASF